MDRAAGPPHAGARDRMVGVAARCGTPRVVRAKSEGARAGGRSDRPACRAGAGGRDARADGTGRDRIGM